VHVVLTVTDLNYERYVLQYCSCSELFEDVLIEDDDEEIEMSDLTLKTPDVSRKIEQMQAPGLNVEDDSESTLQNRIPLTVRTRHKVMRVAPPIDDGFRPFRVF
jgi:hypothetical protein